jgi:hypothetical protein
VVPVHFQSWCTSSVVSVVRAPAKDITPATESELRVRSSFLENHVAVVANFRPSAYRREILQAHLNFRTPFRRVGSWYTSYEYSTTLCNSKSLGSLRKSSVYAFLLDVRPHEQIQS